MSEEQKAISPKRFGRPFWLLVLFVGVVAALVFLSYPPGASSDPLYPLTLKLAAIAALSIATIVSLLLSVSWLCRGQNFRWLLKITLKGAGCLALLIALFYLEEDTRGRWAWEKYKREREAAGERLDFASFVPPPVPDDQNFALAPIVASCYAAQLDGNGHAYYLWKTNITNRLKMGVIGEQSAYQWPTNIGGHWALGTPINLQTWQQFYRAGPDTNWYYYPTNEFPITTAPQTPAADVLFALARFDPALEELRLAAGWRPLSRFPLDYQCETFKVITSPHLVPLQDCVQVLELRSTAELENGQTEKALADIKLMLRLIDSLHSEPLFASQYTRAYMTDWMIQSVWEGLARHRWSDIQLIELDNGLKNLDFISDFQTTTRANCAASIETIDYMRNHRSKILDFIILIEGLRGYDGGKYYPYYYDLDRQITPMGVAISRLLPGGWFFQNEIALVDMHEQYPGLLSHSGSNDPIIITTRLRAAATRTTAKNLTPYNFAAAILDPHLNQASEEFIYTQSSVNLARIACSLERHRLANADYPTTLDALSPQFIVQVPRDLINGEPLHYRHTDSGQFILYSVGWNGKNDGGVAVPRGYGER